MKLCCHHRYYGTLLDEVEVYMIDPFIEQRVDEQIDEMIIDGSIE